MGMDDYGTFTFDLPVREKRLHSRVPSADEHVVKSLRANGDHLPVSNYLVMAGADNGDMPVADSAEVKIDRKIAQVRY
jgi:hypothetical protein